MKSSEQKRDQCKPYIYGFLIISALCLYGGLNCVSKALASDETRSQKQEKVRQLFIKQLDNPKQKINTGVSYWVELVRNDKFYRCNNKTNFRSGDKIRFHVLANTDGYVYILLKKGTKGSQGVLFPESETGTDNKIKAGFDFVVPTEASLEFDSVPGIENVGLLFSRTKLDPDTYLNFPESKICYVASDQTGAKDLVPTRMQLSWDEPAPVLIPQQLKNSSDNSSIADSYANEAVHISLKEFSGPNLSSRLKDKSLVTIVSNDPEGVVAIDVSLQHH